MSEARLRSKKIFVYLTQAEYENLKQMSDIYGMPLSTYCRMAALGYAQDDRKGLKVPDPEA